MYGTKLSIQFMDQILKLMTLLLFLLERQIASLLHAKGGTFKSLAFVPLRTANRSALACLVISLVIYIFLIFIYFYVCLFCFRFICFFYCQTFAGSAHTRKPLKRLERNFN